MISQAHFHIAKEDKLEVNVTQYDSFVTINFTTATNFNFLTLYLRSIEDIKDLCDKLQFAVQDLEMKDK